MKFLFALLLCAIGVTGVSAGTITVASAKIIKGGAAVFTFTSATQSSTNQAVTITATKPIFAKGVTADAGYVTSVVDDSRRGTVAAGSTAGTNAGGTVLTVTLITGNTAAGITTITLTKDVIDQNIQPGIYSVTIVSAADTTATSAFQIIYCDTDADAVTVGIPTLGSYLQGVDAATATFEFGLQEDQAADDIVTVTASQAIFHPSFAAAEAGITNLKMQLGTATAVDKKTGTPTVETDATGKILKLTLKAAFTANNVMRLEVPTTVMNLNPATAGLVTISVTTTSSTVAASNYYPVFQAASTALLYSATVGTDEKAVDPVSLAITIFPQTELANDGIYTVTSSAAIFSTTSTTATCKGSFSLGTTGAKTGECTAVSDTTGKILTITLSGVNKAFANFPITFEITDTTAADIANNAAAAGAGPTLKVKASAGDTTETTAAVGYYIFNAALTPYFKSAAVLPLTGLASGNLTLQFVPQATVEGATTGTTRTVTFTASHAVFTASGSYPGSVCTSVWRGYSNTVPCTAASDATGKILTVTATTATVVNSADCNDFTADEIGEVKLNNLVNPNATAVTFTVATGVDTTATAAGTGYTTTSVSPTPTPTPTPTSTSATSTNGTATPTTLSTTYSTVASTITFAGYTYAADTQVNFGKVVGCAFANCISGAATSMSSNMCTASPGFSAGCSDGLCFTYVSGASSTNTVTAVARRAGSTVATSLKIYESTLAKSAAETAAVTAFANNVGTLNTNIANVNFNSGAGFSVAALTAASMTDPVWTTSSVAVVLPSMMAMFSAVLLVLMQ